MSEVADESAGIFIFPAKKKQKKGPLSRKKNERKRKINEKETQTSFAARKTRLLNLQENTTKRAQESRGKKGQWRRRKKKI